MQIAFKDIDWIAMLTCLIVGQVFLTIWFGFLFAKPWAKVSGAIDPKMNTKEIPKYTYAIGALCVLILTLGIHALQHSLMISGLTDGLRLGLVIAIHFCLVTALPGYAFLKRWLAFTLAIGSQVILITLISAILAIW